MCAADLRRISFVSVCSEVLYMCLRVTMHLGDNFDVS